MTISKSNILGGVLAGGQSRRMGGTEKSLMMLGEHSLMELVCTRLEKQTSHLIINANGDEGRFSHLKYPVVSDIISGFAGPLAGIHAMLSWAKILRPDITHLASSASDTPYFPNDFVAKCAEKLGEENAKIALAMSGGNRHPVFGLWAVDLLDDLNNFLTDADTGKVLAFVHRHKYCMVDFPISGDIDPFFNINHPQDMETAREISLAEQK